MHPDDISFSAAFYKGTVVFHEKAPDWGPSYFGGPASEEKFSGLKFGPKPLHHIATFEQKDLPNFEGRPGLFSVPLFHGMTYDGCVLKYKFKPSLEVLEMDPLKSCDDWPYGDYPRYLPSFPLKIGRSAECSFEEFSELLMQPGEEMSPDSLIVIFTSPADIGMRLWGPHGDGSVQLVFECDVEASTSGASLKQTENSVTGRVTEPGRNGRISNLRFDISKA
jgi:hypothetical protein